VQARWIVVLAAVLSLAAPARGQVPALQGSSFSSGERKIGDYVEVWRSQNVISRQKTEIDVSCPQGYFALSGGYEGKVRGDYGGFHLLASRPSSSFDGWLVVVEGTPARFMTTMTVYTACGPASQ